MKKIIIGIDSVFQFIIASNLRMTLYKDDVVDLVIYKSFQSASDLYNHVRVTDVYRNVYLADTSLTKCGNKYSFLEKFPKYFVYLWSMIKPQKVLANIIGQKIQDKYDEFLFNGYGALPECIFNTCYQNNKSIICHRFEDGYSSYFTVYNSKKNHIRRSLEAFATIIFDRQKIDDFVKSFYFQEPQMVMSTLPYEVVGVPKFGRHNKKLVDFLNNAFDYNPEEYKQKKVYFFEDGRMFFESDTDEEVEIVSGISQIVNPNSILVKLHPRSKINRFEKLGVETMKKSSIPWEVIQLNQDFGGVIFVTITSSPIFSSDIYFGDKCYKILLYKCLKTPPSSIDAKFEAYVQKYKERFGSEYLFIPKSYDELRNILMKLAKIN